MSRTSCATTQTVNSCIHYNRCRKYTALWVMSQQRRMRLCAMQYPILISCSAWYLRADSPQAVLYYITWKQLYATKYQDAMSKTECTKTRLFICASFLQLLQVSQLPALDKENKAHKINIKNRFHNSPPNSLYNIGDTQPLFAGSWGGCASTWCPAAPCHRANRCASLAQLGYLGPETRCIP